MYTNTNRRSEHRRGAALPSSTASSSVPLKWDSNGVKGVLYSGLQMDGNPSIPGWLRHPIPPSIWDQREGPRPVGLQSEAAKRPHYRTTSNGQPPVLGFHNIHHSTSHNLEPRLRLLLHHTPHVCIKLPNYLGTSSITRVRGQFVFTYLPGPGDGQTTQHQHQPPRLHPLGEKL